MCAPIKLNFLFCKRKPLFDALSNVYQTDVWSVRCIRCCKNNIFTKPKDPVTKEQRTDAIYSIPCNDCDNEYIGQTKRQFGTRLKEHQKAVFFCKKENPALSGHTFKSLS